MRAFLFHHSSLTSSPPNGMAIALCGLAWYLCSTRTPQRTGNSHYSSMIQTRDCTTVRKTVPLGRSYTDTVHLTLHRISSRHFRNMPTSGSGPQPRVRVCASWPVSLRCVPSSPAVVGRPSMTHEHVHVSYRTSLKSENHVLPCLLECHGRQACAFAPSCRLATAELARDAVPPCRWGCIHAFCIYSATPRCMRL